MRRYITVVTNSHLAQGRSLGESLLAHDGARLTVVLVDEHRAELRRPIDDELELVDVSAVDAPFDEMRRAYRTAELVNGLKPYVVRWAFSDPAVDSVVCLDADSLVLGPLDPSLAPLADCDVLLTAHKLFPHDHREDISLRWGLFNGGFTAFRRSRTTDAMLEWWADRCRDRGIHDVDQGLFGEQLWLNLAPIYFPGVETLRDPGINVSWFNLNERPVSRNGDGYLVNGTAALRHFHFAFYRPESAEHTALFYPPDARDPSTPLGDLCRRYEESLRRHDYERLRHVPCAYRGEGGSPLRNRPRERLGRVGHTSVRAVRSVTRILPRRIKRTLRRYAEAVLGD